MNTIPRRAFLNKSTPEELLLRKAIAEVENLGAHPLLTDVVVLLGQARDKLADWVDLQSAQQGVQSDVCPSCNGSGVRGEIGLSYSCVRCDGTGKRR